VVREIRVYVEGGAEGRGPRTEYRRGFHEFLREVVAEARKRGVRFKIIACGPRDDAYESFVTAQSANPDALNLLLVDSEGPVVSPPWEYLKQRDGWDD